MKKKNKYFCLLLLVGLLQINGQLAAEDYSSMSKTELDAAFILAVKGQRVEKMQELIQAGANVYTPIPYIVTQGDCDWDTSSTALMYAVRRNCPEMVQILVKGESKLNEALDEAIREGYSGVVEALIEGGADVNYADERNDTPLIAAVSHARATSEFSLQAQARANSRWNERREIIEMLLKAGANVRHVNNKGETALMHAVIEHDLYTVQKLLQIPEMSSGAYFGFATKPINYADNEGNTALILAVKKVRYSYIDNQEYKICVNSQAIIKALLEAPGIDPHHVNDKSETALTLLEELNDKMSRYPY